MPAVPASAACSTGSVAGAQKTMRARASRGARALCARHHAMVDVPKRGGRAQEQQVPSGTLPRRLR
eukprot:14000292-Alexandrium_andersonii.AAC.1